jgi:hypothetical protein
MKTRIILSLLSLLTSSAFGGPIPEPKTICDSLPTPSGLTYHLEFYSASTPAYLTVTSEAGSKVGVELFCNLEDSGTPPNYDQETVLRNCFQPNIADAGFLVQVRQGGFTGLMTARVSEQTFIGPKFLTNLICHD